MMIRDLAFQRDRLPPQILALRIIRHMVQVALLAHKNRVLDHRS